LPYNEETNYGQHDKDYIEEIIEGGERNQGDFAHGAWVQKTTNAVERSFHERRWVDLPLARSPFGRWHGRGY